MGQPKDLKTGLGLYDPSAPSGEFRIPTGKE